MKYERTGVILCTEMYDECVEFYSHVLSLPILEVLDDEHSKLTVLGFGADTYLMVETGGEAIPSGKNVKQNPVWLKFNVKSVDFSYVSGANTLTLMNIVNIAHPEDADGIVVNPQDTSKLIVGTGTMKTLDVVTIAGGAIVSQASPVNAYHLELIDANTITTTAIPGDLDCQSIEILY